MVMLIRKMLRDVWKNKVPFIAIFLMMLAGNFIYSGITCEYNGMSHSFHSFIKKTNLADAWIMSSHLDTADIKKLKSAPNITAAEQRLLLPSTIGHDENKSIDLYVLDHDASISKMDVVSGQTYSVDANGVWLDTTFANDNNYKLHDKIKLNINGHTLEKEIIGLCYSPEYIYNAKNGALLPDHQNTGFAFINSSAFIDSMVPMKNPALKNIVLPYNQILVTGTGNLERTIHDTLGIDGITVVMQKDQPGYSMMQDEITQHKEMGLVFTSVFLFIALLITITTVHRLLYSQRMQVGILKAMGFCKKQLYLHYASHSTFVCLVGSFVGWCIGYVVLPGLIYPLMKEMYTLPGLTPAALKWGWTLPILCALVNLLISLIVCRKYLKSNAAEILYTNAASKAYKELPLTRLRTHLSFYSQWNIRDICHNKLRSLMTVFGVVGCVALLFASLGLHTSMQNMSTWSLDKVQTFETKVTGSFSDEKYKDKLLKAMHGEELMEASIDIKHDGQEKSGSFMGMTGQKYLHLYSPDNQKVTLDKGIALSQNIAKELHIHKGDQIKWRFNGRGRWYTSTVEAILHTPLSQGITMMKGEMEKKKIPFQTTSVIGKKPSNISLHSNAVTGIQNRSDIQLGITTMLNASIMTSTIFLIMAILLGSVILYNLGTLSYMERYRDMATLKVLGFHDKRIRILMLQQNLWLTIIGIILGLPAGYDLIIFMLGTISSSIDISVYTPVYVYAVSLLGTFILSWVINQVLSKKIVHIDMVSALKINE